MARAETTGEEVPTLPLLALVVSGLAGLWMILCATAVENPLCLDVMHGSPILESQESVGGALLAGAIIGGAVLFYEQAAEKRRSARDERLAQFSADVANTNAKEANRITIENAIIDRELALYDELGDELQSFDTEIRKVIDQCPTLFGIGHEALMDHELPQMLGANPDKEYRLAVYFELGGGARITEEYGEIDGGEYSDFQMAAFDASKHLNRVVSLIGKLRIEENADLNEICGFRRLDDHRVRFPSFEMITPLRRRVAELEHRAAYRLRETSADQIDASR